MKLIKIIPLHKVSMEWNELNHPDFIFVKSRGYLKIYKMTR